MRTFLVAVSIVLGLARAAAQSPDPMASISWLAGEWEADAKSPTGTVTVKILNRYGSILNGRALSINTSFNGVERYRGMMGYDPARKAVTLWYLMATGESTTGTMTPEPGFALFDVNVTSATGQSSHLQVHMVPVDPDHYRWELYTDPKGTGMSKFLEIAYHRIKPTHEP